MTTILRLAALLLAMLAVPVAAQTQPRIYAIAIADADGIGGVISYRIAADGKLDGRFALHKGAGRIERETATPRRRGGLAGVYDTRGSVNGEAYAGVMTIALIAAASAGDGEIYRLKWDNGDGGIGVRNGQILTVSFGYGADTVGMLMGDGADTWSVTGIGWRNGAEHRIGLGWMSPGLAGNNYPRPLTGGASQPLLITPNGQTLHLFFDDGSYGVAMPVDAPPLKTP